LWEETAVEDEHDTVSPSLQPMAEQLA
jgi:hypothetical protein